MEQCANNELKAILHINLTPSKTSQLANDSSFITELQLKEALENLNLDDENLVTKQGEETIYNKTLVSTSIKDELNLLGDSELGETFNVSFLNGTAQIATNNGLDIISHTNFVKNPTVETDANFEDLIPNNLVNKKQVSQIVKFADDETAEAGLDNSSIMTPYTTKRMVIDNVGRGIQLGFHGTLENSSIIFETTDSMPYELKHNYDYEIDLLLQEFGNLDDDLEIKIKNNTDIINIVNVLHNDYSKPLTVRQLKQIMKFTENVGYKWVFHSRFVITEANEKIFIMPATVVNLEDYYSKSQVEELLSKLKQEILEELQA